MKWTNNFLWRHVLVHSFVRYTVYDIKTITLWIIFLDIVFPFMCLSTKCCKNLQRPASFEENKPLNFRILCILIFFAWSGFGKSVKIQHVYISLSLHRHPEGPAVLKASLWPKSKFWGKNGNTTRNDNRTPEASSSNIGHVWSKMQAARERLYKSTSC